MENDQKSDIASLILNTQDIVCLLRTALIPQKGQSSVHLWWKGLIYYKDRPSRPQALPLVAFFDHPWVKRHLH